MRLDLTHIQRWIEPGSRVLDLGCGDGEFLEPGKSVGLRRALSTLSLISTT